MHIGVCVIVRMGGRGIKKIKWKSWRTAFNEVTDERKHGFNDLTQRNAVYRYVVSIPILPSINFQRALQIISLLGPGPGVSKWECRYTILFPLLKIKCCLSKKNKAWEKRKKSTQVVCSNRFSFFYRHRGGVGPHMGFCQRLPFGFRYLQWRHKKLCGASLWVPWVCGLMWEDEGSMPHVTE